MADTPSENNNERELNPVKDRRDFIKGAAAAGLLGVAAIAPSFVSPAEAAQQSSNEDPKAPAGLRPNAMLDGRFPMTYENSVPEATRVLIDHFTALSRRDAQAMAATLHYPFASYEGTDPVVIQTEAELMAKAPASINMTKNPERYTDHDGYIKPGSYDVLDGIEMFTADPVSANFSMNYSRYDNDGKKLLRCEGVYCITNNDGKWAIQLMSTIFTPADMEHLTYPDTVAFAKRLRMTHDLAYQVSGDEEVWGPVRQYGTVAGVTQDMIRIFMSGGKAGSTMDAFKVKGVKSRLQVTEVTPESVAKSHTDFVAYRDMFPKSGVGNWGFTYGVLPGTRVIHSTVDKTHLYSGVARYNVFGEEGSTAAELSIVTYKHGRWGWLPGTFAHVTLHDRSNNV